MLDGMPKAQRVTNHAYISGVPPAKKFRRGFSIDGESTVYLVHVSLKARDVVFAPPSTKSTRLSPVRVFISPTERNHHLERKGFQ